MINIEGNNKESVIDRTRDSRSQNPRKSGFSRRQMQFLGQMVIAPAKNLPVIIRRKTMSGLCWPVAGAVTQRLAGNMTSNTTDAPEFADTEVIIEARRADLTHE